MELMSVLKGNASLLARREGATERMECALCEREDRVLVYALTEGELTQETFGDPWHVGCVVLSGSAAEAVRRMLDDELKSSSGGIADALAAFFDDSDRQLADLLDVLDAAHIPYAYRSFSSYAALFRAEGDR